MPELEKVVIVVGFDQKEAIAYHAFCQSIIDNTSLPVQFIPLIPNTINNYFEVHKDGSNSFIYSRFLTPHLMNYTGWAIFADGDMVCMDDIAELWKLRDPSKAILVVKHDYKTKVSMKYLGAKNEDYPRKNWSSIILWNCEHPDNRLLTPDFVKSKDGAFLHRFKWLEDDKIGDLPIEWNWLAIEYPTRTDAKIIHYTLGTPCFLEYRATDSAGEWLEAYNHMLEGFEKP